MCRDKENGGVVIVFIEFRRKGVIPLRTTANSQLSQGIRQRSFQALPFTVP